MFKFVTVFIVALSVSVHSVIVQHDTDPTRYRNLGAMPFLRSVGEVHIDSTDGTFFFSSTCTGVLVDPRTVMTSKHCFLQAVSVVGKTYFYLSEDGRRHKFGVSHTHEEGLKLRSFNGRVYGKDPALTLDEVTAEDIVFFNVDMPMLLPIDYLPYASLQNPIDLSQLPGRLSIIAGIGNLGRGHERSRYANPGKLAGLTSILNYSLVDVEKTRRGILRTRFDYLGPNQLGAGTCVGDSGGPLIIADYQTGTYTMIGITSGGYKDPFSSDDSLAARAYQYALVHKLNPNLADAHEAFFENKTPFDIDKFSGYQTISEFAYLGAFDVDKHLGVIELMSAPVEQNWSDMPMWTATGKNRNVPAIISNNEKSADGIPKFFNVEIVAPVNQDLSSEVDIVRLSQPSSYLLINPFVQLKSFRTMVDDGVVQVDGTLTTDAFTVKRGFIRGAGAIVLDTHPNARSLVDEGYKTGRTMWNQGGHIDLGPAIHHLTLQGNYLHDSDATLSVSVDASASSRFAVSETVQINGGTLNVFFHRNIHELVVKQTSLALELTFPSFTYFSDGNHFMDFENNFVNGELPTRDYRWTVLKAQSMKGRFAKIVIDRRNIPVGFRARVEYHAHGVDVVLSSTKSR